MLIATGELPSFGRETIEDLAKIYIPPDASIACWARLFSILSPAHADLCSLIISKASECAQTTSAAPGSFPFGLYGVAQAETELNKWFGNADRTALFNQLDRATQEYIHMPHPQDGEQRFLIEQVHPAYAAIAALLNRTAYHVSNWIKKYPEATQIAAINTMSRTIRVLAHHGPFVLPELDGLTHLDFHDVASLVTLARDSARLESCTSHVFAQPLVDTSLLNLVRYTVNANTFLQSFSQSLVAMQSMFVTLKSLKSPAAEEVRVRLEGNLHHFQTYTAAMEVSLNLGFDENNMTPKAAQIARNLYQQSEAEIAAAAAPPPPAPEVQEEEEPPRPAKKRKEAPSDQEPEPPAKRAKQEISPLRKAFMDEMESGIPLERACNIMVGMGAQILNNLNTPEEAKQVRLSILQGLFSDLSPQDRLEFISHLSTL